jgi:hypothetical protein
VSDIVKLYRESPAINFSLLAKLDFSPRASLNMEDISERESIIFGSAVDCLLTTPDEFREKFIVATVEKPTAQMGDFVGHLLKNESFEEAYKKTGFKKDSLEKVLERYKTEGLPYVNFAGKAEGKTIIPTDEYQKVIRAVNGVIHNTFCKKYFQTSDKDVEILYQVPIYWTKTISGEEINLKCLVDVIYIDHKKKTIEYVDVKTTSKGVYNFRNSFLQYRYYLQAALYSDSIKYFKQSRNLEGYVFSEFRFLVIDKESYSPPMIYIPSHLWRAIGIHGGVVQDKHIKGFVNLLQDLVWHQKTNNWDYPREVYKEGYKVIE